MLNVVALSLSSSSAVAANAVGLWPVDLTLAAYERIMSDQQFWRSFGISVIRVVISLLLNLVMIVTMAYPLSKSKSISNEKIIHECDGFRYALQWRHDPNVFGRSQSRIIEYDLVPDFT